MPSEFVGRRTELDALRESAAEAVNGCPRLVVVGGAAGVGKTSLLAQFAPTLSEWRRLSVSGEEAETRLPYGLLSRLLSGARPDWSTGASGPDVPDPFTVGAGSLQLLGDLQQPGPLALVIDDAPWSDPASLQALAFMLRRLQADRPVQGFSSIVDGRVPGEYLAMPDNGYGAKATSADILIRAYYITPDFKTANGGTGAVRVGLDDFIQFNDRNGVIGFPIVNEGTTDRLLTGGDIDPESLQRAHDGDLWVGDEFGPWILHFDAHGTLLDRPFEIPGVRSPNNPWLAGQPPTQPNSRGFEGMAITPDGRHLYAALEGANLGDSDQNRWYVYEFSITDRALTGRTWLYRTSQPGYMVADIAALDVHRLVLIERDAGLGATALFRRVNRVDLRDIDSQGYLTSTPVVDLTAIPDPDLISLPAIHAGDIGLGDPFNVVCESVEAVHPIDGTRLLIGCDNNFPNKGRNPGLADDTEFIVVKVDGLRSAS